MAVLLRQEKREKKQIDKKEGILPFSESKKEFEHFKMESSSPSHLSPDNTLERSFFIRMKSTLTKRGVHIKSSGYKVIHITGRLRIRMALTHNRTVPNQIMGMVVVAHALPPPTINEVRIDCQMFVTRVNMDLNIVYCENRISDYMDLTPVDIIGKRCYQFIHAEDVEGIRHSHLDFTANDHYRQSCFDERLIKQSQKSVLKKRQPIPVQPTALLIANQRMTSVINKGQCVTKYYRWIQKNGGYIWIQSSATIAINAKNANEKNIIWVNYVLSNPEYKDTPMDITQLPNLPEKASESSETSDSESDSKDNSEDNDNSKSDGKGNQSSENSEEPESESKKPTRHSEQEMRHQEEDSSSNAESQESEDSLEPSDCEAEHKESRLVHLSGLPIKVEHYGDGEGTELHNSLSSSSEEEEEEDEEEEDNDEIMKDYNSEGELSGSLTSKRQKRKKRRKKQKWEGSHQRLRLSPPEDVTAIPGSLEPALGEQPPLLSPPSPTTASVLKIKTEMAEPINFDNDSSIWNFPPNREISRNESPFSMTKPPSGHEAFPAAIPDSVLTPPGTEGGVGIRKPNFSSSSSSSSNSGHTSANLAPPLSNSSNSDPLSPPLSASPRDKQQGTPTSQNSLLYSGDLEALQRLQTGNVVLPLVQRVAGTLAATSTAAAPRVYTAGTIRYAPADVTLAVQGNLLPTGHAAVNFVDVNGPGFGIDAKTPMEMLYHHVHRLNMSGPFGGAGTGASLAQMPTANVFTTAEGLFSTLPFPVYSNGIHTTQTLERKED
ncbi:Neuronal PAS domain-containing protein 3 [Bagarius yarrelli]|uniref:Neuronal PAS domain-containing protein 3 n=1 Tax=Bagarius yarrelli TaxID=175774 RepID=A0A556U979_BAGYA|nr:Neuronal PAS domain-containing protein 3 [Bagarius yarrelli]